MTLLISVFAAVICTAIWYKHAPQSKMLVSVLCWIYWGASIMWLVDAIFEYVQEGTAYFQQSAEEMLNDAFLGLSVVALGLIVWIIVLLIKDPRGVIHRLLSKEDGSSITTESCADADVKAGSDGADGVAVTVADTVTAPCTDAGADTVKDTGTDTGTDTCADAITDTDSCTEAILSEPVTGRDACSDAKHTRQSKV